MNRYGGRGPTIGGPSKATGTTLCQKCLKRGHYSYECKEPARPYVSRPSRTQQLFNPKLVPKLTNDAPQDLLRKKGIADEQLAKVEMERERGRKRERQSEDAEGATPKRLRSASSTSSVSTISTAMSRSRSPTPQRTSRRERSNSPMRGIIRTRSPVHSRSPPRVAARLSDGVKRRRESISSVDSYSSADGQNSIPGEIGRERANSRSTRRKYQERSPPVRGRRTESRTPPPRARRPLSNDRQNGKSNGVTERKESVPRRERSLSPFSKRLALTQAMNKG